MPTPLGQGFESGIGGTHISEIIVRPAQDHAELHACVDLQIAVWSLDPKEAVPFSQLHAAHTWGGQVLVAMDGDRLVGFCYGFGGRLNGRPSLCSHMAAVLPDYRGRAIGVQLKLGQAHWAREFGYDLITWTYDPLEAVNANLNIARLGGIVRQYLVNHYGQMLDGLNKGLPSDRLLVEWHLTRPAVARILAGEKPVGTADAHAIRCRIPRGLQQIKTTDSTSALRWRLTVREQLQRALMAGYVIQGFEVIDAVHGEYLLTKENSHAD